MNQTKTKDNTPKDIKARDQISQKIDESFFIEAGAGTGKTTSLVERVVSFISNGIPCENILIITFTKKATAELRTRIKKRLLESDLKIGHTEIDKITISTIHGFTNTILNEHPIKVGLPYDFSNLEGYEAENDFIKRWRIFVDGLDLNDPIINLAISIHEQMNLNLDYASGNIFNMARRFQESWDLFKDWDLEAKKSQVDKKYRNLNAKFKDLGSIIKTILISFEEISAIYSGPAQKRKLQTWATAASNFLEQGGVIQVEENIAELLLLFDFPETKRNLKKLTDSLKSAIAARDKLFQLSDYFSDFNLEIWECLLADFTLTSVQNRIHDGKIIYHDLLVLTQKLLNDPKFNKKIQKELSERYPYILIDEFQDTDPIQLDIATKISNAQQKNSSLVVVGDPKQSIYAFRGADIKSHEDAKESIQSKSLELVQNFRTIEPIITWINQINKRLSENLMENPDGEEIATSINQVELQAFRKTPNEDIGPPVVMLDAETRQDEAENVALSILWMLEDKWKTYDEETKSWRQINLSDICILVPVRTKLEIFTQALQDHNLPYLLELGEFIYERREVRDLIHLLYALENPDNDFAVVRALRTPLFGVSDSELYDYKKANKDSKKIWNYLTYSLENAHQKIKSAFEYLQQTHELGQNLEPSQLVNYVIHSRLQLEVAKNSSLEFTGDESEFQKIKKQLEIFLNLIDGTSAASLSDLLEIIQAEITSRKKFTPPIQDSSENAVRVMTIHGAKGLEFPVTILTNLEGMTYSKGIKVFAAEGGGDSAALYFNKDTSNSEYKSQEQILKIADRQEDNRTLYVGATRARDHLLVSIDLPDELTDEKGKPIKVKNTRACQLGKAHRQILEEGEMTDIPIMNPGQLHKKLSSTEYRNPEAIKAAPPTDIEKWKEDKDELLNRAEEKVLLSTGDVRRRVEENAENADNEEANAEDEDDAFEKSAPLNWVGSLTKGKGSNIGNAVHKVMQHLDFSDYTDDDIQKYSKQFARDEEVPTEQVEKIVRNFLDSEIIQQAKNAKHLKKEVQLQTSLAHNSHFYFRGFLDLLYVIENDGKTQYFIVDFKTTANLKNIDAQMNQYKYQGASYVMALEENLASEKNAQDIKPEIKMSFLFGNEKDAQAIELSEIEIAETIAEIKAS